MALVDDFGESKVTVSKNELLAAMRANLTKHEAEYKEAIEGYKAAVIARLKKMLACAEAGKPVEEKIGLPAPESHTEDYERVIRMLEMSKAEEISITENQFSQYVLDKWNWQRAFKALSTQYSGRNH